MTTSPKVSWRNRLRGNYTKIVPVFTCGAGLFSDGYLNGVASPVNVILKRLYPETFPYYQKGFTSSVFAGTVLGQLTFGWISDHCSRKFGMVAATLLLILFSALSAGAYGAGGSVGGMLAALTAYRFLLGIGIGGEYPAGSVACAEATTETPRGSRNFLFIVFSNFCIDLGFVVSAFVPLVLLWIFGTEKLNVVWRLALGLGIVPPLSIFYFRLKLKEPEQFRQNHLKNVRPPYMLILKFYWKRLLPVSLVWFIYNFSSYAFGIYSTQIVQIVNPDNDLYKDFAWAVLLMLFYLPGSILGAYVSDKLGPNRTLALGIFTQSIIGYIMAGLFPTLRQNVAAFVSIYGIFMSLGEFGPGNNIGLLASKTSATAIRGQYYGIAAATGKVGAFIGAYIFPIIIENAGGESTTKGLQAPFWVSSSLGVVAGLMSLFLIPNISQDCIEQEDERFKQYLTANNWDISQFGQNTKIMKDSESEGEASPKLSPAN